MSLGRPPPGPPPASTYSDAELHEVLVHLDRDRFPERHREVVEELARRRSGAGRAAAIDRDAAEMQRTGKLQPTNVLSARLLLAIFVGGLALVVWLAQLVSSATCGGR